MPALHDQTKLRVRIADELQIAFRITVLHKDIGQRARGDDTLLAVSDGFHPGLDAAQDAGGGMDMGADIGAPIRRRLNCGAPLVKGGLRRIKRTLKR